MQKLDSPTQEDWFDFWVQELVDTGYIDDYVIHPNVPTFELFPGLNKPYGKKKNTIMRPVSYTPDRIIQWNVKAKGIFFSPFISDNDKWDECYFNPQFNYKSKLPFYYSIVEVKGPTGNQKAYGSDFKFTQKWLWANTQQYVQKVMLAPIKPLKSNLQYLWAATFTPKRFLFTDKLTKGRTIPNKGGTPNWEVRSLKQFIKLRSSTV